MSQTSSAARSESPRKITGFTLIELLAVIAVIVVLVAITFGLFSGVKNAQARAKAKTELAVLSAAIEQYKARYGDYPMRLSADPDPIKNLAYALDGRVVLQGGEAVVITDDEEAAGKPKFIDFSKFDARTEDGVVNKIIDPWGFPYRYYYKWDNNQGAWDYFGFHLYSTGPEGDEADPVIDALIDSTTGVLAEGFREQADAFGVIFAD